MKSLRGLRNDPEAAPVALDRRLQDLLTRFGGLLGATIRRMLPRDLGIDTQDIEQEARIRLWKALGRATEGELAPSYVQKVAATATIDAIRGALARRDRKAIEDLGGERDGGEGMSGAAGVELESVAASPEDLARRRDVGAAIESSLSELGAPRRRAVRLHLFGLSAPEIARLTGWSATKTRTLISRGLADLRTKLNEKGVRADDGR